MEKEDNMICKSHLLLWGIILINASLEGLWQCCIKEKEERRDSHSSLQPRTPQADVHKNVRLLAECRTLLVVPRYVSRGYVSYESSILLAEYMECSTKRFVNLLDIKLVEKLIQAGLKECDRSVYTERRFIKNELCKTLCVNIVEVVLDYWDNGLWLCESDPFLNYRRPGWGMWKP